MKIENLKSDLFTLADKYTDLFGPRKFTPGQDYIPPSGKVVGLSEFKGLLDASSDMWLTAGRFADDFEKKFPKLWGMKYSLLVNSGSSANLVALASLTSPRLGDRALKAGDEIITTACGFPTTVAPAIQYGLKPVFIDVDITTHNASVEKIKDAITDKTKIIMIAHALGNPFRSDEISKICEAKGIWLIEDCCDALGAKVGDQHVGSFGDLATCSFYPAHHITMGEGGAVLTNSRKLYNSAMSFRDWGRDCWCPPGTEDTCCKRFGWKLGDLPEGYDHKYIYSHIGFNLKSTDLQAAVGLAQLERLEEFVSRRRENHDYLNQCLKDMNLDDNFHLPEATPGTTPSWFGFFMCLKDDNANRRKEITKYLEENKVGTRLLFGGNLVRQPAFQNLNYTIADHLNNTDHIMNNGFWVGIWPGLEKSHLDYMAEQIRNSVRL